MADPLMPLFCEPTRADGSYFDDWEPFGMVRWGCEDVGGARGLVDWLKFIDVMSTHAPERCERHIERCERRNARARALNAGRTT